ncbi:aspartate 1-decarboxylase [Clostridium sp. BJN0013]|uniref:aspartate 1-decarboxylase n=1 Tax=Clostridium sp. BJN0013 TaxID=3236840 RepID=UPI0034C6C5E7
MQLNMLKSKIHRATVTEANLNYVGSITIDRELMERAHIIEYEKIQVVDIDNGNRLETYVIAGEEGSKVICLNGAAARCVQPGDKVILMTYCQIDEKEAKAHKPIVVFLNENNSISQVTDYEKHGQVK